MNNFKLPIFVTQPSLPSLDEFTKSLQEIWNNKWLTNNGPFHQEFEKELALHLKVPYISIFSNGTLALLTALQVLKIKGEVITTPYSFVATAHSILWNGLTPVFCDVNPINGNIDVDKIEALITDKTSAILPVHVYGNPIDVYKLDLIAKRNNLKVIYDAAHAFGVEIDGKSILNFGDLSVLSFHATKTFNTIEGGAIISHNAEMKKMIDYLKNFGFQDEVTVIETGINAKVNEIQAAYGLIQLKNINNEIEKRKNISTLYFENLKGIKGLRTLTEIEGIKHNYSYYPIFIENSFPISRDSLYEELKSYNIFGRRYFYPLITEFPMYKDTLNETSANLSNAKKLANEVICLPIYANLEEEAVLYICDTIKKIVS